MQLRRLGASGLMVSPVCLGTMTFGTPVSEADSIRLVHEAIDLGINFIDTAPYYGATASETVLGKVDSGFRIATAPQAVPRWRRR
jgi:aryl-alcohol dehydrogenase-like predicted oxidoreductase